MAKVKLMTSRVAAEGFERIGVGDIQYTIINCTDRHRIFEEPSFAGRLRRVIDHAVKDDDVVLSLDVFDTLLLRDNSSELLRFVEIGEQMAKCAAAHGKMISQIDAFLARHLGTKATYRASRKVMGAREGSLKEIYLTATRLLGMGDAWVGQFVAAEIEYEATRIRPNWFLVEYAKAYKAKGGTVILVSDMYFHSEHIRDLLRALRVDEALFDAIISSGDEKISKASGLIFEKVAGQLGRQRFFHIGDSFKSDYIKPVEAGWNALHLPISQADLVERRNSHDDAIEMIRSKYALTVDVARP